ncbi:MAG: hypothetical protein KJ583_02420 [Nanoarchaeota archaeon]|nr:hypothetical protein [Nanoarchaeota archaeon]MBU1269909.1 hypothetical protein [Nanoarchaeota archaeon]MBU1604150.1 hypothetical protein [Nanoarchaeota archaeon]MBU2443452.1 hypothetical protein [Nanoarchaeota archaeon]
MIELTAGYVQQNHTPILHRFFELFTQPFKNSDMIWMLIPVIGVIILMEIYWTKHKREEEGWNTVTANSLVLIFVSIDLFRFLSKKNMVSFIKIGSYEFLASILVLSMLFIGMMMFLLNFTHFWPKLFAYTFSSIFAVNIIAYLLLVIIYSGMALDVITLFAATTFFLLINLVFFLFRKLYPSNG